MQRDALSLGPLVFEPLHEKTLFVAHNAMPVLRVGRRRVLPAQGRDPGDARSAFPEPRPGDVLIFEERLGPRTGREADRRPRHPAGGAARPPCEAGLTDQLTGAQITEIRWAEEDALPFPFCLSSQLDDSGRRRARDGGLARARQCRPRRSWPARSRTRTWAPCLRRTCTWWRAARTIRARRPEPVAGAAALPPGAARGAGEPGRAVRRGRALGLRRAQPGAGGTDTRCGSGAASPKRSTRTGPPRPDLLGSAADDTHFVVEIERDGAARLRFGDDRNGQRPNTGTAFTRATTGSATAPSATSAREAIGHVVTGASQIIAVRNPLPATGGVDPETWRRSARPRPVRLSPAGARRHRRRLRRGRASPPRRAARRRHVPLERPRPHRLRHGRPLRRPPGHGRVRGRARRLPRPLPHGGLRPRGRRRRALCRWSSTSSSAPSPSTFALRSARQCSMALGTGGWPTAPPASSTPTTSPSATPST